MKKVTKVIEVYSFEELASEKAKEKACQQVGDRITDAPFWWDSTFDLFVEKCKDYGMNVDEKDIKFSGFGSQGDGASFTCDDIDVEKILHSLGIKMSDGLKDKVLDYIYEVNISRTSWRAFHEQTVHVEVFLDEDALVEEEEEGIIQDIHDIADTLEFKLEKLKDDLCKSLYNELRQEYEFLHSAAYVSDLAYYNKMLFLANGIVYDWGE